MKKIKEKKLLFFLIFLLAIGVFFLSNTIKTGSPFCFLDSNFEYVEGEVVVGFVQDVTKEEVNSLLSQHNLLSKIRYPEKNEYRIYFNGDTDGFLDYLSKRGFVRQYSRVPSTYIFEAPDYVNCKIANEIANGYLGASISDVHCFGHVWGVVYVKKGTERYWMCKLLESEIVKDTNLNGIVHTQISEPEINNNLLNKFSN
jgi:hypothetical protein